MSSSSLKITEAGVNECFRGQDRICRSAYHSAPVYAEHAAPMIVFGSLTDMWQSVLKPGIALYGTTVKQHSSTGRLGGQVEAIVNDTRVADMRRIRVSIAIGVAREWVVRRTACSVKHLYNLVR